MASLQILNPVFSSLSISISHPNFPGKSDFRKKLLNYNRYRSFRSLNSQTSSGVYCAIQEGDTDNKSNGEEPPESLFMKELKRRGMAPTSLLEDSKGANYDGLDEEMKVREEPASFSGRKAVSAEFEKSLSNQRERSMELNSEGLEGLVPRAKLLLTIGGTFFLGFWPLILSTIAFFSALYFYFGPSFIHDDASNKAPISPPQYVDPYALLEDEKISQTAPRV